MNEKSIRLTNSSGVLLATGCVRDVGTHFEGTIDLSATPPGIRAAFIEFEEVVNSQQFSVLDDIHARIDAFGIRAVFDEGEVSVENLQVFPEAGEFSFRSAGPPKVPSRPAFAQAPIPTTSSRPVV